MAYMQVSDSSNDMLQSIAQKTGKNKQDILDQMMRVGMRIREDDEMTDKDARAMAMGSGGDSVMDKLLMMKMLGAEGKGGGDMKEMMMMLMMVKAMNAPPQSSGGMDPLLMVMMMGMGGKDKGGMGVREMKELMEIVAPKKGDNEDATLTMMSQFIENQNKGRERDRESKLEDEISELKNLVYASLQGGGQLSQNPVETMETSLDMVEKVKSTMQERGLLPPRSSEELDREQRLNERQLTKELTLSEITDRKEERKDLKEVAKDIADKFDKKMDILLSYMTKQQRDQLAQSHPELNTPLYEPRGEDLNRARNNRRPAQDSISGDLDDID